MTQRWPENDILMSGGLGVPTLNLCTYAEVYLYQKCLQLWKYPQRVASGKKPQKKYFFKMLITPERKFPQRSDASQITITMQKSDKGDLRRLARPPLKWTFKNPTFQL